jgi:MFS family permease
MIINDEKGISKSKIKENSKKKIYFLILYLLFIVDFIARVGINSILPMIQTDMNLNDSQIGILSGVVLLGMAIFVLPISILGEKKSTRKAITISSIIWGVGSLFSGLATNFLQLSVSRFFVGIGNSAFAPLSTSTITSWYDKSKWGKVIGLFNTAMVLGGALGAIVFVRLSATIGWKNTFYIVGIVSLILSLFSLIIPDNNKKVKEEKDSIKNIKTKYIIKSVLENKALIIMCLGAGIAIMALNGLNAWLSVYFVREMGMSMSNTALIVSFMSIFSIIGFPIGGLLLDIFYKKNKSSRILIPAICIAICGIFYFLGFYFNILPLIILAATVYTFGGTAFHTASQELVPKNLKSVSYAVYVLFIQFLGALGPILVGLVSQYFNLRTALVSVQILFVISALILFRCSFLYVKYYKKAREEEVKL